MGWFGDLNIALKYGMVVGTLLFLTMIAGIFKIIYDRRKMRKLLQDKAAVTDRTGDEEDLNMREKDEGDLFGVRAIEAGYFGGVAQSAPSSVANSPISTPRSQSPVSMFSKPEYNRKAPQMSTYESPAPIVYTASTARSASPVSAYVPPATSKSRKGAPQPIRVASRERLKPSEAELSGRRNHGKLGMEMMLSPPFSSSPLRTQPILAMPSPRPTAPSSDSSSDRSRRSDGSSTASSSASDKSRRSDGSSTSSTSVVPVYLSDRHSKPSQSQKSTESAPSIHDTITSPCHSCGSHGSSPLPSPPLAMPMPSPPPRVAAPSSRPQSVLAQSARLGTVKPTAVEPTADEPAQVKLVSPAPETSKSSKRMTFDSAVEQALTARQRARQSSCALPSLSQNPYARQPVSVFEPPSPIASQDTEDEELEDDDDEENNDTVSPRTSFSFAPTASEYHRKPMTLHTEPPRQPRKLGSGIPLSAMRPSRQA